MVLDRDDVDAGRVGQRDVGGDEGHLGAAGGGGAGQGVALLPEERLPRKRTGSRARGCRRRETTTCRPARSGGGAAAPRASTPRATAKISAGSGSRPVPVSAPVSRPTAGSRTTRAAAAQRGDVGQGGRVLPHLGVHRRREHHRAAGGEQGVGEQVVGQAVRGPGQQVGGGRGDDDQVGLLAEPDVRHLVDVGPDVGGDRLAGQRRPGGGADEPQRRRGRARR